MGYGYDVTGKVASYESVRAQAIDVEKFENEHEFGNSVVVRDPVSSGYSFSVIGRNVKEYLFDLTLRFKAREYDELKEDSVCYFWGTLFNNELLKDDKNKYSYRSDHLVWEAKRTMMSWWDYSSDKDMLRPYFTKGFAKDIAYLPANDVIEKYGTHIVKEYTTGIRFDMLYRSDVRPTKVLFQGDTLLIDNDKLKAVKAGFTDSQVKTKTGFMHWESPDSDHDRQVKLNINPVLYLEAHGGDSKIVSAGTYNLEKGYPDSKQTEWRASVNDDDYSLIFVKKPFPIYELLDPSPRRDELKKVIDQYILESQVK